MRKIQKMVFLSLLVAQALVLSIVEGMIPVPFITPGAKLGLANIVTVVALYTFNLQDAFIVVILRIFLATLLGGTVSSLFYSLAGGLLSLLAMYILKKLGGKNISVIGVSVTGAFFHNVGQIIIAALVIKNMNIIIYLPILSLAAIGTGLFVGFTANYLLSFLSKFTFYSVNKQQ